MSCVRGLDRHVQQLLPDGERLLAELPDRLRRVYCSCTKATWGRCRRGTDGTYYGFFVQDVLYVPLDQPFHTAFRVARARMTHRPA